LRKIFPGFLLEKSAKNYLILPGTIGHSVKRVIFKPEVNNETKKESTTSVIRNKYTVQFKEQFLERADRDGIPIVAVDLGLSESMLYSWRSKLRQANQPLEEKKLQQAELARLKRENIRLEEEVAFLKIAAAYFAKIPK